MNGWTSGWFDDCQLPLESHIAAPFEWIDHLVLLVEIMSLDAILCRLLRNGMEDQFEFPLCRRDGLFDRRENMRRRELIHRGRQRRSGFAEEGFEFAPAGFRTDADGQF